MRFDGRRFARSWLSVSIAAGDDASRPTFHKAVFVEFYEGRGARLLACNGAMLMRSWVPLLGADDLDTEPEVDVIPDSTIVLADKHGIAKSVLAHVYKVTSGENPEDPEAEVTLDVARFDEVATVTQLPGMETVWASLSYADEASLRLHSPEGSWVDWRSLVTSHEPHSMRAIALTPDTLARLGKLERFVPSAITFHLGGAKQAALFQLSYDGVEIDGVIMPAAPAAQKQEAA